MLLKLQNGDTINGQKLRREGVQSQLYQKRVQEERNQKIDTQREMRPVLVKRASFRDKLRGKKDTYKRVPSGKGMSGADPVGKFVVETIALSPLAKIPVTKVFKSGKVPTYKTKTLVGIDGNPYRVNIGVSDDALDQYIADSMIYGPETRTIPDQYLLDQNVLRQLSWAPESTKQTLTDLALTGKTSNSTALLKVPFKDKINALNAYSRAIKTQKVKPVVKNYQSMPKSEMEELHYLPIADNVQGVTTKSGSYVKDLYNSNSTALHEGTHFIQNAVPYSKGQKELLRRAYPLPQTLENTDSKLVEEMGATNAEFRRKIASLVGGKPTYEQLNSQINRLTDNQIYKLFTNFKANGYMDDYIAGVKALAKQQIPVWAQNMRLAQIKVPATVGYLITRKKNE